MPRDYDAVFFDLGGTLFSYSHFRQPLAELIGRAGARLGSALGRRELGRAFNVASARAFAEALPKPYYLHRDVFCQVYREFARELSGAEPPESFVAWFYEAQRQIVIEQMELREDCLSTLSELRSRGLTLAVVSNIDNDYLDPMIAQSGLAPLLHAWTSSETARSCKPDARFFQLCLERAEQRPERVLFVGDSPVHDVAGARAQGMHTALIEEEGALPPGQGTTPTAEPHFRIRALGELLELVPRG